MSKNIKSKLEQLEAINRIANTSFPIDNDKSSLIALSQLLGYRKRIAEECIKNHYSEEYINLLNYVNEDIKRILCIVNFE